MASKTMTPEQYRLHKPAKKSKYRNQKVIVDGIEFDSKKEAKRYGELKVLFHAGQISELDLHPVFPIVINDVLVCKYEADFKYIDGKTKKMVVEDVKGLKTRVYSLKKRLMLAVKGIEIVEK